MLGNPVRLRGGNKNFSGSNWNSGSNRMDDGFDHRMDLRIGEFRINGKRDELLGATLSDRKGSGFKTEMRVGGLHVDRTRIMDRRADVAQNELLHEIPAIGDSDYEEMMDVFEPRIR